MMQRPSRTGWTRAVVVGFLLLVAPGTAAAIPVEVSIPPRTGGSNSVAPTSAVTSVPTWEVSPTSDSQSGSGNGTGGGTGYGNGNGTGSGNGTGNGSGSGTGDGAVGGRQSGITTTSSSDRDGDGDLAWTGTTVLKLLVPAVALLLAGIAVVVISRRRRASQH